MTEISNIVYTRCSTAKAGFRWFGPDRDVAIGMIAQIPGITDVVSALHHIPNGEEWTIAEILKRKIEVEFEDGPAEASGLSGAARDTFYKDRYGTLIRSGKRTGLVWSTVESLPFTEEIKNGSALRDQHIVTYQKSLDNIGVINQMLEAPELKKFNAGLFKIESVMGNFMLVADWTRTGYAVLSDGSRALEYNHTHFSAFDIFMVKRHKTPQGEADVEAYLKDRSYSAEEIAAARGYWEKILAADSKRQEALADMIVAGLPGAQASFGVGTPLEKKLDIFREAVLKYKGMTVEDLRRNITTFLKAVVPHAQKAGVILNSHPDDPAFSPFLGTPRAVGDVEGYKFLLDHGCGVGLCFGSLLPNAKNRDVMGFVKEIAEYGLGKGLTINQIFPFIHLRPVETDGKNFCEGLHAEHIEELGQIIHALSFYGWHGVFRPDHAPDPAVLHDLVQAATGNPKAIGARGYSVPGRAMGANLLIGLFEEIYKARAASQFYVESLMPKASVEERKKALKSINAHEFERLRAHKPSIRLAPARSRAEVSQDKKSTDAAA